MSCPQCQELAHRFEIRIPGDLKKAIAVAKAAVLAGSIEEVEFDKWGERFATVDPDGPWDDIVSHRFECRHCKRRFELTAETYHGRGGAWRAL